MGFSLSMLQKQLKVFKSLCLYNQRISKYFVKLKSFKTIVKKFRAFGCVLQTQETIKFLVRIKQIHRKK